MFANFLRQPSKSHKTKGPVTTNNEIKYNVFCSMHVYTIMIQIFDRPYILDKIVDIL